MRHHAVRIGAVGCSELRLLRSTIPDFLCPALFRSSRSISVRNSVEKVTKSDPPYRCQYTSASLAAPNRLSQIQSFKRPTRRSLPHSCPGCGAPSQTIAPAEAGYFDEERKAVKTYLYHDSEVKTSREDDLFNAAVQGADAAALQQLGLNFEKKGEIQYGKQEPPSPICERCHNLTNYNTGTSIVHPTVDALRETIEESPHKVNHIYHVLDAADFPMSLIPNLQRTLELSPLRGKNRRAKQHKYVKGRVAEVSFVITRSDLLAPRKEQVDSLMPYLVEVLRDALGRANKNVRLGNVRCVSAKRGWWTKDVKETIWKRGGGGWMVGKVNVGKSNLFEAVFPKGRNGGGPPNIDQLRAQESKTSALALAQDTLQHHSGQSEQPEGDGDVSKVADVGDAQAQSLEVESDIDEATEPELQAKSDDGTNFPSEFDAVTSEEHSDVGEELGMSDGEYPETYGERSSELDTSNEMPLPDQEEDGLGQVEKPDDQNEDGAPKSEEWDDFDNISLLPPPQPEMMYPTMPIISSLPGTTAAPIRVPFGKGKGELIDLPGLPRTMLEDFVRPEERKDLVMHHRIPAPRIILKPGKSLLLGGLVRITPCPPAFDPNLIFMVHPFVRLDPHVTSTEKAEAIQTGLRESGIQVVADTSAHDKIASAGTFPLKWDVTRKQAGPLTRGDAVGLKPERLPFIVYSTDILIEGCGWVEITAQVRRRQVEETLQRARREPFIEPEEANPFPRVEVFSPEGKFIGARAPMGAWLLGGQKREPKSQRKARPRQSMRSVKAQRKPQPKECVVPTP